MYNNTCATQSDKNSILAVSVRIKEKYSRGRRGAPAKGVGRATGARVQIPLSPLYCQRWKHWGFNASFFENPGSENPTKKFVLWYWQILDGMLRYRTLPNLIVILKNEKINFKKLQKSGWQKQSSMISYQSCRWWRRQGTLTNEQQCDPEYSNPKGRGRPGPAIRKDGGNSERQKRV